MNDKDVIIIGGGMVGMTLAIALADGGLHVAVIDREAQSSQLAPTFDGRVSAIAYGSRRILQAIGAWEAIAREAEPILDIRVADQGSSFFVHYDHQEVGGEPLGHIVENRITRKALFDAAAKCRTLELIAPASVKAIARDGYKAEVELADGRVLKAALLVGADGKQSWVRKQAGIKVMESSYGQTAIVCTIQHERLHHGIALEHFLPVGPFAVLPMTGQRSSLVWTEKTGLAPHYLGLSEDDLNREIYQRTGGYLGEVKAVGPRFAYPLVLTHAEHYIDTRLALVGDAAHAIHPIAGQGVNLGFRDVAVLAQLITEAHTLGLDVGSDQVLERYQRWRRFDSLVMIAVTDSLTRLFSNNVPALKLARNLGFAVVNKVPPAKRFFMRHAMGITGDLPKLMQG